MRPLVLLLIVLLLSSCGDQGGYIVSSRDLSASASAPTPGASRPPELILPLEVDSNLANTFVRIGFGMEKGFQSTDFLTPRLRTIQAVDLIRIVKQYNDFEGERVASAVLALRGKVSGVEFGRDGSPVLFVELPYWTHQREEVMVEGIGVKISESENDILVREIRRVFVDELKASEFSVKGRRVRIWWS